MTSFVKMRLNSVLWLKVVSVLDIPLLFQTMPFVLAVKRQRVMSLLLLLLHNNSLLLLLLLHVAVSIPFLMLLINPFIQETILNSQEQWQLIRMYPIPKTLLIF